VGARVHETAVVHPEAELADGVEVGPLAVVGAGVVLGRGTRVLAHAILEGPTRVGEDNVFHSFSVTGGAAQLRAPGVVEQGVLGRLVIGHRNVVREHVTIHRGKGGSTTTVGDGNLLMVGCHVAHDVTLGSNVVVANHVQLAGHAQVADHATFGGLAGVAQFVKIGESAFVAAGAMCERDVPPFVIVQGDRARVRALNKVGLERRGIDKGSIARLDRAFRALFRRGAIRSDAAEVLAALGLANDPWVATLLRAVASVRDEASEADEANAKV
jgi:UDP-N-acetylglucosamine acyltransferase